MFSGTQHITTYTWVLEQKDYEDGIPEQDQNLVLNTLIQSIRKAGSIALEIVYQKQNGSTEDHGTITLGIN